MTRHQDINDALEAANEFSAGIGLAALAGIYTGMWFVVAYLFGWLPPGVVRWLADYSQPAGELLDGDLVVGHQHSSTPIDQSLFEDSEISGGGDVADCQTYKDALERVVNRIQIEVERKTSNGQVAAIRRSIIREIASEAFQAIQT